MAGGIGLSRRACVDKRTAHSCTVRFDPCTPVHAPRVSGAALNAYAGAGIHSDHEATTYEEALEKRRLGMWVMLREASIARNLADLLPLVQRYGPERCLFCTDDREPNFIVQEGHLDQMLRKAVAAGVACVFMEVHQDPDHAPSDGPNMVKLKDFPALLEQLVEIDAVVKR